MTRHDPSFAAILIEEDRKACVRQFAAGRFFIGAVNLDTLLRRAGRDRLEEARFAAYSRTDVVFLMDPRTGLGEVWVNPRYAHYRRAYFAWQRRVFAEHAGRHLDGIDVDHIHAKSAAIARGIRYVRLIAISSGVNRERGWIETHCADEPVTAGRDTGLVRGHIIDLMKAIDSPFIATADSMSSDEGSYADLAAGMSIASAWQDGTFRGTDLQRRSMQLIAMGQQAMRRIIARRASG